MKTISALITIITTIIFTSCSADDQATYGENASEYILERTYGARSFAYSENGTDDLKLNDLPAISLEEACDLLATLRKKTEAKEDLNIQTTSSQGKEKWNICMSQTISNQHTFIIELRMSSYADGSLYYTGYKATCQSSFLRWHLSGFSLSSDIQTGNYKFEAQSYLYLRVVNNGIKYLQVPVKVKGNYNPNNHQAAFSYTL